MTLKKIYNFQSGRCHWITGVHYTYSVTYQNDGVCSAAHDNHVIRTKPSRDMDPYNTFLDAQVVFSLAVTVPVGAELGEYF